MSATTRRNKRQESKKVLRAQGHRRLKSFFIKQDCGCCTAEVQFESEDRLKEELTKLGLCNGGVLVDDAGVRHEGLDTFYGYSTDEEEARDRSLGYLAQQVIGLGSGRKRRNQKKQERRRA